MKRFIAWIVFAFCTVNMGWAASEDPDARRLMPAARDFPFLYVATPGTNSVTVIKRDTNAIVTTIPVSEGPAAVAVTADGKKIWAAAGHHAYVIDAVTYAVEATIPFTNYGFDGPMQNSIVISPTRKRVYVVSNQIGPVQEQGAVIVIDKDTHAIVDTITVGSWPWNLAITPDGKRLYVANSWDSDISIVNTETDTVLGVSLGTGTTFTPAVTPDGKYVYTTYGDRDSVEVVDTATNAITDTITWGINCEPISIAFTPNGKFAYVPCGDSGSVFVIDTKTNTVIDTISPAFGPFPNTLAGVVVGPYGRRVYLADSDNAVYEIDTSTNTISGAITVPGGPSGVAIGRLP